ncbi:MAG TPA: surface-adhesin E family protein [Bryobacteraceae bacterium]|nr:surface-adhesin E family protein [Bryobacteraceae bacterium]
MRFCIVFLLALAVHAQRIVDPPELTGKPTKPRKEPDAVAMAFITAVGKAGNNTADLMTVVSGFIKEHPTFGDAYGMRVLSGYCELKAPASDAFIDDVNKAMQYFSPDGLTGKQAELYGMRARLQYDLGRFPVAVDDLERGIRLSPEDADDVVKVGTVKPGPRTPDEDLCNWTQTELDGLATRFPKDYRVALYRGLYLGKLTFYRTEGGDTLVPKAVAEFQKALALNPKSALPHYFLGRLYSSNAFWDPKAAASDKVKEAGLRQAIAEYTLAINLDPKFKGALANRAGHYLELKEYQSAIRDFDRAIELSPKDAGLYHDRALAYDELGNPLAAIVDFNDAIRLDTFSDLGLANAYENRGDTNMKLRDFKAASADYTQLIKLRLDMEAFLIPLSRWRAFYPEYVGVTDDAFLKKIHDMFFPNYDEQEFAKHIKENEHFADFLLPQAYEKRTDAYLKDLRFRKAVADYHRAVAGTDDDGRFIERWRSLGKAGKEEQFLDMKSATFGTNPSLWIKTNKTKGYEVQSLEFDCTNHRLRTLSFLMYDEDGKVTSSSDGERFFQPIIPDTVGEQLLTGACRTD